MIIHIENKCLDKQSADLINRSDNNDLYFKQINKNKIRSYQQLKKYWSHFIKIYAENFKDYQKFVTIDKNGHFSYDVVHRILTLNWALEKNRPDLIKEVPCLINGKKVFSAIVHINFSDCSQKDFNDFMEWIESSFFRETGKSIKEVGYEQI